MAWKMQTEMDQKISFIRDYESGDYYFNSLCLAYGISRQTGYSLVRRWKSEGEGAFSERSRRPHGHPWQTSDELVNFIIRWRHGGNIKKPKRVKWGAKKIRVKLVEKFGAAHAPSVTTIHNILLREGEVLPRTKRRAVVAQQGEYAPQCCNEIMTVDYKGWFLLGNQKRCYPLTICDAYSRYIHLIQGGYREHNHDVLKALKKIFREWGQPLHVLSDNGSPFASIQSPCGYGYLSYWLIDHGIMPLFSDPGRPDQNGRHERMHRELKAECCKPSSSDLRVQNRRMNSFRCYQNEVRPHEGIGQQLPSTLQVVSPRPYRERVPAPEYDQEQMRTKKVCANGAIRWGSYEWVSISNCLKGKYVGVKQIGPQTHEIYYRGVNLGYFREGEDIVRGNYYRLISDRDIPARYRDRQSRSRKVIIS